MVRILISFPRSSALERRWLLLARIQELINNYFIACTSCTEQCGVLPCEGSLEQLQSSRQHSMKVREGGKEGGREGGREVL